MGIRDRREDPRSKKGQEPGAVVLVTRWGFAPRQKQRDSNRDRLSLRPMIEELQDQ